MSDDDDIKKTFFFKPPEDATYQIYNQFIPLKGGRAYTIGDMLDEAYKKGRAEMLEELRAKVPTEADMHRMSLQHCCDWPQEVYHPNDLRGFWEAGLKALEQKIFGEKEIENGREL